MLVAIVIGSWLAFLWIAYVSGKRGQEDYPSIWSAALLLAVLLSALLPILVMALAPESHGQSRTSGPTAPLAWIGDLSNAASGLMIALAIRILLGLSFSGVFLLIYLLVWGRPKSNRH